MLTIDINTYSELREIYAEFNENYVYRGQGNSIWEINSSLFRNKFISNKLQGEQDILMNLEKSIHLY